MGDKDRLGKLFVSAPRVFADIANWRIHGGRPVIQPEDLRPVNPELVFQGGAVTLSRLRDMAMELVVREAGGHVLAVLGVENQSTVDWYMPVRVMTYNALQYEEQVRRMRQGGKRASEPCGELSPVITVPFFYGAGKWTGPRSLHELMPSAPGSILACVPDNPMVVLSPDSVSGDEIAAFPSELGLLLGGLKYADDADAMAEMLEKRRDRGTCLSMGEVGAELLSLFGGMDLSAGWEEERREFNMCKAFDDYRARGRAEGIAEGMAVARAEACKAFEDYRARGRAEGLAEARAALEECRARGRAEGLAEARAALEECRARGKEEGLMEGRIAGKAEVFLRLVNGGLVTKAQAAEACGLSPEEADAVLAGNGSPLAT